MFGCGRKEKEGTLDEVQIWELDNWVENIDDND